jgi:hypothetical protein
MPGNPVVGSTILRRPAIQSPDYVPGTSGWAINADGTAEFNNMTLRGTVIVGDSPHPQMELVTTGNAGVLLFLFNSASFGDGTLAGTVQGSFANVFLNGPANTAVGFTDFAGIVENSSDGVSSSANGVLVYTDAGGGGHTCLVWDTQGVHIEQTLYGASGTLTIGDNVSMAGLNLNLNMGVPTNYPLQHISTTPTSAEFNAVVDCLNNVIGEMTNRQMFA